MATQRPAVSASPGALAGQLLAEREVAPRAQLIAAEASARLGVAVVVYLFDADAEPRWTSKGSAGDVRPPSQCEAVTLAMLAEQKAPVLFSGAELVREHYAHLDVRRTIVSLAYVPLSGADGLIGALEAISFDRPLNPTDLAELSSMADVSSRAIAGAIAYESERNSNLETITRLAAFYDIEKQFHSTLKIHDLLPIITSKVRELLPCDAVSLWMVEGEALVLHARDGEDPTVELGAADNDIVHWVADKGKPLLVRDRGNPILKKRQQVEADFLRGALAVPLIDGGSLVGVLECVNKSEAADFDEDDHFLLATIAESATGALHNASLLEAERKIEILETLVEVSNEITSTLNLERVLQMAVNGPQRILRYDRAAVAMESKGKLRVKAISGKTEVSQTDPAVRRLAEMLEWASLAESPVHVTMHGKAIETEREETRAKFQAYFAETGMRAFYAMPLGDEQGRLGVLSFESGNPDFVSETHFEFLKVVAAQATVALRNASLYQEVPLIGVLEPIANKRREFERMGKRKRRAAVALGVATLLFLVFVPLPMRVAGESVVAPQTAAEVRANVEGVIGKVYVREGDRVGKGTVLAEMEDWDYRAALAGAQAKRATAEAAMNRALASGDGTEAGMEREEAAYWVSETERAAERLERTKLRSPIEGVVATPHIEGLAGRRLEAGEELGKVINTAHAVVDVKIEETDVALLEAGQEAVVKLEGLPGEKYRGRLEVVSPASEARGVGEGSGGEGRVFYGRVDVKNEDGTIRAGMSGMTKVSVGWRPAGYVAFRGVGMWAWTTLWNWFGW